MDVHLYATSDLLVLIKSVTATISIDWGKLHEQMFRIYSLANFRRTFKCMNRPRAQYYHLINSNCSYVQYNRIIYILKDEKWKKRKKYNLINVCLQMMRCRPNHWGHKMIGILFRNCTNVDTCIFICFRNIYGTFHLKRDIFR